MATTTLSLSSAPGRPEASDTAVRLRITNRFGQERLRLNQPYTTLAGDAVELTRYAYYLSNVRLTRKDGTEWTQLAGPQLLETEESGVAELVINLTGMPEGDYYEISFAVGLDSTVNHGSNRAGVLNPDFGMFWAWESSYVFLKCEGYYQKPPAGRGAFVFHVAHDACYRTVRLSTGPQPLTVTANQRKTVDITANAQHLFGGLPSSRLTLQLTQPKSPTSIMTGENAHKLADNYARMFALDKTTVE